MPGNPVRRKPETDLSAIPGTLSPEQNRQRLADEREAMKAYKASMKPGNALDYARTPLQLFSNATAGLVAEMLGKGKQFEEKYGYMPKTKAEMDAVEAMIAVMSPGLEAMDYLKIPPIIGPNTPTIGAAMQGVDRAAARLTADQAKRAAANAGQAVKKAATSDDMAYAVEKLAQKAGFGPKQIMMGPTSKTWNHGNAALAKHMELQGADPMAIWETTGTFRGADGNWRQEIPDNPMAYTPKAARQRQTDAYTRRRDRALATATTPEEAQDIKDFYKPELKNAIYNLKGKMSEFVDHPELRAAYPDLFDRPFKQLEPDHPEYTASQNTSGFFNPTTKEIVVNGDFTEDSQRDTVLHELQHAVQQLEGWQGGSSPGLMAMHMADRDALKYAAEKENELLTLLAPKAKIRPLTEQSLKDIEGKLEKYKQLEGVDDPFKAYERASGEEEARAVERRSRLSDEDLKAWHPSENYDTPFSEHITDFADGGEVHMAGGGFLDMMAKAAKQGVTRAQRLAMTNKDVARRIPALEEAIAALERGEITKQQYAQLVQAYKPVAPYETFFNPEPDEKIIGALTKTNREKEGTRPKQSYFGVPSSTLKRGDKAATRQDIPSYTEADTWVVTAHQPQQGKRVYAGAGPRIGYEPVAMLNDVRFEVQPNAAMKIAKGGQKGTIATMEGYWEPITRELAEEMGPELMRDPRWVQAGMDPTRSASFYNRETMQPILEGEQVLHSGPLVLVKNPLYGDIEDFPFKEGGAVTMAKGGILGALAKTAEAGIERAAKTAKAMQPVLPAAEREANLAKFLEESTIKNRMYHGSRGKPSVSKPGEEGIREFKNSARQMTFASPNTDFANFYAGRLEPEGTHQPTMYPVYIQAKNPWDYENPEHIERILPYLPQKNEGKWSALVKKPEDIKELLEAGNWGLIENPKVIEAIQKAGFDAAHMQEMGVKNIGVFDPKNIKSAIGNRGTYDINDPDITKAAGGGVTIDEFLKRIKAK